MSLSIPFLFSVCCTTVSYEAIKSLRLLDALLS
uniref:Uncharacterized protein n=1 Tax=Arundo donax TaxID=35708 RepID=A0A0A8YC64_ARUDO